MEKRLANHDYTYCTSKDCNLCWRHEINYIFEKGLYSFMNCCGEYLEKMGGGVADE